MNKKILSVHIYMGPYFIGPRKLSATQAVLQLHPARFGIYLHRHSILAAHKKMPFLKQLFIP